MSVIATTNTQHYENIADGLRTAGDLSNYKSELAVDAEIFEDISDALQSKTGQVEPYAKDELAQAVSELPTDLISKTITQNGVYNASSDNADGYDVVTVDVPEKNTLDEYFADTLEVANIPSATSLDIKFFYNHTNLGSVIMPNVTTIGNNAFQGCTNLLNVIMPNVTNMGNTTFQSCINLALTSLPSGVTNIGLKCFSWCTKLALTSLPNSVTSIDSGAFEYCTGIQYLDFSEFTTIPTLGTNVFLNTFFPFYFRDQQQIDEWAATTNWSTCADRFQIKPSEVI